jgi:hypothetical protein
MFVPGTIDSFQNNIMNAAGDEGLDATAVGQINSLRNQINNRRMAIAICTVAAIAFVALAVTLTSIPTAIVLGVSLLTLPIICLLTVQLHSRAAAVRRVMMGEIPARSDDESDTEIY